MEVANVKDSTKNKVKGEDKIITDEGISIDNKNEIRTDVEGDSNIHIKSRTQNIINKEDNRVSFDIG